jgi:hypothetical protein
VAESALLSRAHQLRRPAKACCFLRLPNTRWGRSVSDPVIVKVGDLFADISAFTGTHDRVVPARASHLNSFIHILYSYPHSQPPRQSNFTAPKIERTKKKVGTKPQNPTK